MSQSLADVIVHLVFSTKERRPWLQPSVQEELYQYICGICHNINSPVMQIDGVEDHIHILLHLGKNISISKLVSEIKSNSSRWIKTKGDFYSTFSWQSGYGAFSVSRTTLDGAKKYIASQKERHKTISFKNEFLMMLDRAQIAYDEKYLWD